jgi:hypothetical protein
VADAERLAADAGDHCLLLVLLGDPGTGTIVRVSEARRCVLDPIQCFKQRLVCHPM